MPESTKMNEIIEQIILILILIFFYFILPAINTISQIIN